MAEVPRDRFVLPPYGTLLPQTTEPLVARARCLLAKQGAKNRVARGVLFRLGDRVTISALGNGPDGGKIRLKKTP
jgi:hypothetical protein